MLLFHWRPIGLLAVDFRFRQIYRGIPKNDGVRCPGCAPVNVATGAFSASKGLVVPAETSGSKGMGINGLEPAVSEGIKLFTRL